MYKNYGNYVVLHQQPFTVNTDCSGNMCRPIPMIERKEKETESYRMREAIGLCAIVVVIV